jgi:hypothetical protein
MEPNTLLMSLVLASDGAVAAVDSSAVDWLWGIAIASTLFFVVLLFLSVGDFGGVDGDATADPTAVKYLSLLGMMVLFAFGSWTSLLCIKSFDMSIGQSVGAGAVVGALGMVGIARLMKAVSKFEQDGTIRTIEANGTRGEVYARVPPAGQGEGQVRIEVSGRLRTYRAVNEDDQPIESFTPVVVTGVSTDRVLRVRRTG